MTTVFSNKETDTVKGKLFIHTKAGTKHFSSITRTMAIEMAFKQKNLIVAVWNGQKLPVSSGIHG